MEPEALYLQLGQLVAEMPNLAGPGPITADINRWLGRAAQLVAVAGDTLDAVILGLSANNLNSVIREANAQTITAIVYRALAHAEANAPISVRGGYVGVRADLDALQVVSSLLAEARRSALVVDPHMDSKVFTDFGPALREGVAMRLLADGLHTKLSAVQPALLRWKTQFGSARPIQVRLSTPRALHDRLIIADGTKAWLLSQSLKDFASRSPAVAQRLDPELAEMKIGFYESVWAAATPVQDT